MAREHKEFHTIDMNSDWVVQDGYPPEIKQKILSGELDQLKCRGSRTRLLKFEPGAATSAPSIHDYCEEVYILSGDLIVGYQGEQTEFLENTYSCRPPHKPHGPFSSKTGCIMLEICYYE